VGVLAALAGNGAREVFLRAQAVLAVGAAPVSSGDLNGDGAQDLSDAVHLLNFLFSGGPPPVGCVTSEATEETTIFVVRHAEKSFEPPLDPELTPTGFERAERLALVLGDHPLDLLLASTLQRTVQTLQPLSENLALDIEQELDVGEVVERLRLLPPGSHAAVAHHSFTILGILDGLGVASEDLQGIRLSVYDNLFVVKLRAGGEVGFLRLRYGPDIVEPPPPPVEPPELFPEEE